jgi:hypothetical protein
MKENQMTYHQTNAMVSEVRAHRNTAAEAKISGASYEPWEVEWEYYELIAEESLELADELSMTVDAWTQSR